MHIKKMKPFMSLLLMAPSMVFAAYVPPYTILTDSKDFEVHPNGRYTQTSERKIRIETAQGIDRYGQAKLFYDGKRDKLEVVEAYTIKPDGQKITVSSDRIKLISANTEDVDPYFTDQMTAVIIFPQVEVGSQLYFKATLTVNEPIILGRFSTKTAYTPHRRYENAKIKLTHPADMSLQVHARDVEGIRSVLADGRIQHVYLFQQDFALPPEPGQVEYEDFAPTVLFSNYKDYTDLAQATHSLFQPKTRVTPDIQMLADELTYDAKTPRQKAKRLYDWVSKNIRYVGIDVGASGFEPHYAEEIMANRYGDCKDHATILESLLMAAGISSSPALIKSTESFELPRLAGNYYFDHVITYVPEFDLYLDSTSQFAEFGTLPPSAMGKNTLITRTGIIGITPRSNPKLDFTVTHTKLRLLPDGSIVGKSKYVPHGYYITNSRAAQFIYENREMQSVVDNILSRFQETGGGEMTHGDPTDLSNSWEVLSNFKLDPVINMPGASAFALPTGLTPGFIRVKANTKPYEGRRYPFSCGSNKHVEDVELELPKNVHVSRIPKGIEVRTAEQSYRSIYKLVGNRIYATREISTNVHADVCEPSQASAKDQMYILKRIQADLRQQIFLD